MAKKRLKKAAPKASLPNPGDAFLMPLADGRFGACRVIRRSSLEEQKDQGSEHVLAAASAWIGTEAPALGDPRLREILRLNHHSYKNQPEINWLSDPVPESFQRLGMIEPTPAEERMECFSHSGWESFPLQLHRQWRWDHERDAVLREEAQQKEAEQGQRAESAKHHGEYLAGLTLEGLRKKRRLSEWKGFVPDKVIAACRKLFRDAIDSLIDLGPTPKKRSALGILRQCIERLNQLDDEHRHFISTIEREDLCEEFDEIAYAAGFRGDENLADRWREW